MKPIDERGLDSLVNQRNGKFLLLNVWATWCVPCREEFPDLIKLADTSQNTDVEIVGLSADYPDEVESKIIPFLKKQNVTFKVFVQNFRDEGNFINRLSKNWSGALPATFIFDPSGKQRVSLSGKHDYGTFKLKIEKITRRKYSISLDLH